MTNVAFAPDGTLGVAFRAVRGGVRDIHLALSKDFGDSFADPILVQNQTWTINGCPATGPSLVFDASGSAHVAWRDARDARPTSTVYYATVDPENPVVTQNIDLSSATSATADYPSVAVDRRGERVMVLFESSKGVVNSVRETSNGVFTPTAVDALITHDASTAAAFTSLGSFLGVWQTTRSGKFDVASLSLRPTSVNELVAAATDLSSAVLPAGTTIHLYNLNGAALAALSADGSCSVAQLLDTRTLPYGVYLVAVDGRSALVLVAP
jgi:hypothetical protein